LSTLSPNKNRIADYVKHNTVQELFFPVWSQREYWAIGLNEGIVQEEIDDRYNKFGGIVRHLFRNKSMAQRELDVHLGGEELDSILKSEVTNVDTDPGKGNVSGYLVCYTDIPCSGDRAFESRELMLTSSFVRDAIRENMELISQDESVKKVRKALGGNRKADLGGFYLEVTFTAMIQGGSRKTKWKSREVGTAEWKDHQQEERTVERVDNMASWLSYEALLLVPLSRSFPVVDIVESQPEAAEAVTAYQITWRDNHPITMGALRKLRGEMLEIGSTRPLKIFFVVPGKEEAYAKRQKMTYLPMLQRTALSVAENKEMWDNTSIYVLKPKEDWKNAIETFFHNKQTKRKKEDKEVGLE
jgi:hypothetical protein